MTIKSALIVDDSKSARVMLQRLLEKLNVDCQAVECAEDAFEYLQAAHPDVIFMDHMMPGMDGLQAAKTIKQNPKTADIPTVMYTSKEESGYKELAHSHGAQAVLAKPANQQAIMAVLGQIDSTAANDHVAEYQISEAYLQEIEDLISKQIKLSTLEAKAEITAGLDSITQQVISSQRQLNQNLEIKFNDRLRAVLNKQEADFDEKALFKKLQPQVQRMAMLVADKMIKQKEEELVLSTKTQIAKFRGDIAAMSKEIEIQSSKNSIKAIAIASSVAVVAAIASAVITSALL